jgi:hypothetical protein
LLGALLGNLEIGFRDAAVADQGGLGLVSDEVAVVGVAALDVATPRT